MGWDKMKESSDEKEETRHDRLIRLIGRDKLPFSDLYISLRFDGDERIAVATKKDIERVKKLDKNFQEVQAVIEKKLKGGDCDNCLNQYSRDRDLERAVACIFRRVKKEAHKGNARRVKAYIKGLIKTRLRPTD
jgi:hypothetical protein